MHGAKLAVKWSHFCLVGVLLLLLLFLFDCDQVLFSTAVVLSMVWLVFDAGMLRYDCHDLLPPRNIILPTVVRNWIFELLNHQRL